MTSSLSGEPAAIGDEECGVDQDNPLRLWFLRRETVRRMAKTSGSRLQTPGNARGLAQVGVGGPGHTSTGHIALIGRFTGRTTATAASERLVPFRDGCVELDHSHRLARAKRSNL